VGSVDEVMQDREDEDEDEEEEDSESNNTKHMDTGVLFLRAETSQETNDWVDLLREFSTPASDLSPSPTFESNEEKESEEKNGLPSPDRTVSVSKLRNRGYTLYVTHFITCLARNVQNSHQHRYELVDTERKFVNDLHKCVDVFRKPMKSWLEESKRVDQASSSRNIFDAIFHSNDESHSRRRDSPPWTEEDMNLIFGELDKVLAFNQQLLQALETILPDSVHSGADLSELSDAEITKVSKTVANVFLKFAPFLLLYQGYVQKTQTRSLKWPENLVK